MTDRIIEGVRARDFGEWLAELNDGAVMDRLSEKLLELVAAVQETHRSGALVLKIVVKEEAKMAVAVADIKLTKPEHKPQGTLFYFADGALVRENPRQLRLREMAPARPPKIVTPTSASVVEDDKDPKEGA